MYISIAGNIGSGKTTLTKLICEEFGWKPYYEDVATNPYLSDFYNDTLRWSFNIQIYFLNKRLANIREVMSTPSGVTSVMDKSIYEDAEVFAKLLNDMGVLGDRDFDTYTSLYEQICDFIVPPKLLIYLKGSIPTLKKQIRSRGIDFEVENINDEYLEQLNSYYNKWAEQYNKSNIISINLDEYDIINCPSDMKKIFNTISDSVS
ncbi:MAG: deoxynucleoside kinase [Bacteroidales bacterium]